jgi:hypothetical protein
MANVGAPAGNNNASKNKMWTDAIRKTIVQKKAMEQLADVLIKKALEGDMSALKEIGDRLEGKPNQSVSGLDGAPLLPPVIQFALDEDITK